MKGKVVIHLEDMMSSLLYGGCLGRLISRPGIGQVSFHLALAEGQCGGENEVPT